MTEQEYQQLITMGIANDERTAELLIMLEQTIPGSQEAEYLIAELRKCWKRRDCFDGLFAAYYA